MPTIKLKKATADYIAEKEREKEKEKDRNENPPKVKPSKKDRPSHGPNELKRLDGEVLFEKRKRTVPPAEQASTEWVEAHLVSKPGFKLSQVRLYEFYCDSCLETNTAVVEPTHFARIVKDKVGKQYGFLDSSPLKELLKETKFSDKPKSPKKKGEKQGETVKKKLQDAIQEVLTENGNPLGGFRFAKLQFLISQKYPALRVDVKPMKLLQVLENEVYYRRVNLLRGVGKCGFYRLPGGEDEAEDEENKDEETETAENGVDESDDTSKKSKKKKKTEGEEGEVDENGEGTTEGEDEKEGEQKKKKRKRNLGGVPKSFNIFNINHSNPKNIEESFALAVTYCSEPKESTLPRMKKYIARYYPKIDIDKKLKPALDKGADLGIWELTRSTYALNIQEFDPNLRDSIDDVICAAIIATTEPKVASARAIKNYVQEYHPDFNIENRPIKFKVALTKAVNKRILRQVSGLGASGSYQLGFPFTPSPSVLAGDEDQEEIETVLANDNYMENYVVRKTKSGRQPSTESKPVVIRAPPKDRTKIVKKRKLEIRKPAGIVKKVPKGSKIKNQKRGRKSAAKNKTEEEEPIEEEEEEEEKEEEEEVPSPKSKTPSKKSSPAAKGKNKRRSRTTTEEVEEVPKSGKKNKRQSKTASDEVEEEEKEEPKSQKKNKRPSKVVAEEIHKDEEEEEDLESSKPIKKRSRNTPKKKTPTTERRTSRGKSVTSYKEGGESETDRSDDEDEPVPKKKRGKK